MKNNKDNDLPFDENTIEELPLNDTFRKKRTEKNISHEELSEKTGISTGNIKKIESGEWEKLPADIYVKDFLSKCAKVFDTDESIFLNLYEKEVFSEDTKEKHKVRKISKKYFVITPKLITKLVFTVFIVVILSYFSMQLSYLLKNPEIFVTNPKDDIITELKEVEVKGSTHPDNKVTINEGDIFVESSGDFSESIILQSGINTIKIKATNRLNKESIIIRRIILEE